MFKLIYQTNNVIIGFLTICSYKYKEKGQLKFNENYKEENGEGNRQCRKGKENQRKTI